MRVGAVIQARAGSKRFPGKIFQKIGPLTVIERVALSIMQCQNLDEWVLAYPGDEAVALNGIIGRLGNLGCAMAAGSTDDVLMRMIGAASLYKLDAVVRVCADSPFLLPWLIDYGVETFRANNIDYLSTRCFPVGQNIEIIKTDVLKKIHPLANAEEREHVTLYLERHYRDFNCQVLDMEMTVDNPGDIGDLTKIVKYYD